ncbi:hypothetical protein V202x_43070 [Gimesia aquarii]|uniref:SLH domain-containing protein n=1 Tax=Gimesia aquarii TaxID=2527964 RepID=A0A517X079_9PLAN|nr:hypothetical protein V202x_43070 [Gimesia aquarii]
MTLAENTSYYVQIGGDAFDDAVGNSYPGISDTTTWNFTTTSASSGSDSVGGGGARHARQRRSGSGGGGGGSRSHTAAPALSDVGIADHIVPNTSPIGGIYDPSLRSNEGEAVSRQVEKVLDALSGQREQETALRFSAPPVPDRSGLLLATVGSRQVVYHDVPANAWFAPFVATVISDEIATGYADADGNLTGEFGVANPVTYAELLRMALQTAGSVLQDGIPHNTTARDTWAAPYVATAETLGLSLVSSDRDLHQSATRGEVIHTLLALLDVSLAEGGASPFTDLPADHRYRNDILTAVTLGLIAGDTDVEGNPLGTVRPDAPVNRAEVAKIIAIARRLRRDVD